MTYNEVMQRLWSLIGREIKVTFVLEGQPIASMLTVISVPPFPDSEWLPMGIVEPDDEAHIRGPHDTLTLNPRLFVEAEDNGQYMTVRLATRTKPKRGRRATVDLIVAEVHDRDAIGLAEVELPHH